MCWIYFLILIFLYDWYRMLNIFGTSVWTIDSIYYCRCIKYWESTATSNTIECQGFCWSQHFYISKSSHCGVIRGKLDQLPEGRFKEPFRVSFQLLFFSSCARFATLSQFVQFKIRYFDRHWELTDHYPPPPPFFTPPRLSGLMTFSRLF